MSEVQKLAEIVTSLIQTVKEMNLELHETKKQVARIQHELDSMRWNKDV